MWMSRALLWPVQLQGANRGTFVGNEAYLPAFGVPSDRLDG